MKNRHKKISIQISSLLIAIVITGGTLVFLTAPNSKTNDNQLQLQQELQENTILLSEEQSFQKIPETQESTISISTSASDSPVIPEIDKESSVQFTAIGDSVMLGTALSLKEIFPDSVISAAESRQVWEAESLVTELESNGKLLDTVVIALGANGSFSQKQGQSLLDSFDPDCRIYWVAPYGKNLYWKDSTLEILQKLESENENLHFLKKRERFVAL